MATLSRNSIFTNVALTPDGGVWWEGMTDNPPAECLDWRGEQWTPAIGKKTRHAPQRIPMAASPRRPRSAPRWIRIGSRPRACPISAIIFGGRRSTTLPLVYQAFNWSSGVYIGATMGSETTAAATGALGKVRRDPMAMLPFCGYHMGDYFRHWIKMQRGLDVTPRIFNVNWFRKDDRGPVSSGRDSARTCACCAGSWSAFTVMGAAAKLPIGWVPRYEDIDWTGSIFHARRSTN